MSIPVPTVGRIVAYALTEYDAESINRRRKHATDHMAEHRATASGVMVHSGNAVQPGDVYPLVITRAWGSTPESAVNGQLLLDGNDTLWVTSTSHGDGPGRFTWPGRA